MEQKNKKKRGCHQEMCNDIPHEQTGFFSSLGILKKMSEDYFLK